MHEDITVARFFFASQNNMNRPYQINNQQLDVFFERERFLHEVIEDKEYEYLFNDLVFLDVGCNIGTFSWSMYSHAKMIYALDISSECIETLRKTIERNNLTRIQAYNLGLSGFTGRMNVSKIGDPHDGGWRLGGGDQNLDTIETVDIETFMERENIPYIDVMKIDIEGGEREVFESESFKRVQSRIHTIMGEYHGIQILGDLQKMLSEYRVVIDEKRSKFIARRT